MAFFFSGHSACSNAWKDDGDVVGRKQNDLMSSVKYRLLRNAAMCVLRVILSKLEEQCETQKCFPANRMTPSAVQQQCTEVKAEIHLTVRVPLTKGWRRGSWLLGETRLLA